MAKIERTFPPGEGEENYRAIFENAGAGIYQTTLEGRFVKANVAMARILRYDSPEDLVSTVTDVGTQLYVDSEQRQKLMSELEVSQVLSAVECQFFRKDGSTTWVRLGARIVRDAAGKSSYCEGIIEDISSYKESEQKLADQARELAAANESLKAEVVERKRAEQVSRGQAAALVKSLDRLAAEPELDEFIGLVLQVIAEQLRANSAALWLFDQESEEVWMHLDYTEGRVRKPEETSHPHASGRVPVSQLPWWPFDLSVDKPAPLVFNDVSRDPELGGFTRSNMPRRRPPLDDPDYLAVTTYILRENGFPAGNDGLTVRSMGAVRIEGKDGPKPLPPNALVQVTGCLTPDGVDWDLSMASLPTRSRNSDPERAATEEELTAARELPSGDLTFDLTNFFMLGDFDPAAHAGHKMLARGALIRRPSGDRISLFGLDMVAVACGQ